jgi:hypothetical protein
VPVGLHPLQRRAGQDRRFGQGGVQLGDDQPAGAVPAVQGGDRTVVHHPAVVDHHEAWAEPFDVGQIVGGQHQGGVPGAAQFGEETPHRLPADHVESDRRLVQEEHLRTVQQGGGQLAAHPLAERELTDRDVEEGVQVEQVPTAAQPGGVVAGRHPVDVPQQLERVAQGQVPPELGALPEHHADAEGQPGPAGDRLQTADADPPGGRGEHAGEHLQRGGLAGPVRADVAEHLAALHPQVDPVHGGHHPLVPA